MVQSKRAAVQATIALLIGATSAATPAEVPVSSELVTSPGTDVAATIEGQLVSLHVLSAGPDRLVINAASADRLGLKPAILVGRANLNVAGRREFEGKNRPVDFTVGGAKQKGRALWFPTAPPVPGDGTIGPWGLPQSRVTLVFGPTEAATQRHDFSLFGSANSGSGTSYREEGFGLYAAFDLDDPGAYPIASAAAGAAIAKAYGGQLGGPSWDVEILFGIKRPVRLMTLARPFKFGPLSFTKIAVRVRDRIDAAGRGEEIRDADRIEDPSEVVVTATAKGRPPIFSMTIPRAAMPDCSRLTFDKGLKRIELWCKPT
ncbi:MAG: hypothetical protein C0500_02425 [Sphingobium sp.]|nr:hypothetical protein [Sphingobium sp.]